MIRGPKASEGPCIEYVSDSLVHHGIQQVKYYTDDQALPEDKRLPVQRAHPLPMRSEGLLANEDF
jgi:hypothetical protein